MKGILITLLVLLAILQYELWFHQGYFHAWELHRQINQQMDKTAELQDKNNVIQAEVDDLKTGHQAVEEQARNELGMVKKNEKFYQVVKQQ